MSVLADLRNLSSKEYYKNALCIRKELELYLTRDFAKKALKHNISTVNKQINDADKVILNEISSKYMPDDFRIFKIDTPKDYADSERKYLINLCREITSDVGDWKIIKIYEARLQNLPDPYNYEELSAKREAIRERIREITTELENYV